MIVIEASFFLHYKINETWLHSYMRQIISSDFIWTHDKKDEFHRWFTYTFLHASTSHITMNVIFQVSVPSSCHGKTQSEILKTVFWFYGVPIETDNIAPRDPSASTGNTETLSQR